MILKAPAKVNWFLLVRDKRVDGYHDIVSLMQKVSLYDTLTLTPADDIVLTSDLDLPAEDNLVVRAANLLREHSGYTGGVMIDLRKEIPSGAGLGGGSSDAAATLAGLNRLWALGLDDDTLMKLGARLGSDVPFFLGGRSSLAEGRGERLTPLPIMSSCVLLLVKPGLSVSTGWAYDQYEKLTKKTVDIKLFCQTLDRKDFAQLRQMACNDLEDAVMKEHRVIAVIKDRLREQGSEFALMSGSGSTVFGVFSSQEMASRAAAAMGDHWCRVVNTLVDETG
ncbi:MAG: 4-(cytidine 5'-diphospho)-2-C-methyl-D-erythritol kinase [Nitrospirae bacterium]|nr:MAG: 4-(cytidine 5'-diphospho)-2-C-methyl-D-erythritol kinase [Nitrospirota bacterium]